MNPTHAFPHPISATYDWKHMLSEACTRSTPTRCKDMPSKTVSFQTYLWLIRLSKVLWSCAADAGTSNPLPRIGHCRISGPRSKSHISKLLQSRAVYSPLRLLKHWRMHATNITTAQRNTRSNAWYLDLQEFAPSQILIQTKAV